MSRLARSAVLASFAVALAAPGAFAQSGDDWVRARVGERLTERATFQQIEQAMFMLYNMSEPDARGVSKESYDRLVSIQRAQARTQRLSVALARDLDGDGVVTRDELRIVLSRQARQPMLSGGMRINPTPEQVEAVLTRLLGEAMKDDLDGDGRISFDEMVKAADKASNFQFRPEEHVPLDLDADGDGVVSPDEFRAAVRRAFDEADSDRDGIVSKTELDAFRGLALARQQEAAARQMQRKRDEEAARRRKLCDLPDVAKDAKLVVIGAYGGAALSATAIGDDKAADVTIEPGREPIHLVLTSFQPMIWRFRGATERVSALVASAETEALPQGPRVGVSGVDKSKIRFVRDRQCYRYFWKADDPDLLSRLATISGRSVDALIAGYQVARISAPSGAVEAKGDLEGAVAETTETKTASFQDELRRFYPSGLVRADAARIEAPAPARDYDVLPQEAGVIQLIESGALTPIGSSVVITRERPNKEAESKIEIDNRPAALLITRKIVFPAGLHGGHLRNFLLPRSVPVPEGDPGHSKVLWDDTREPVFPKR